MTPTTEAYDAAKRAIGAVPRMRVRKAVDAAFATTSEPRRLTLDDFWEAMKKCARVGIDDPDVHARAVIAILNERAGL